MKIIAFFYTFCATSIFLSSCNNGVTIEEERNYKRKRDSAIQANQMKFDSILNANRILQQKAIDSFNKTPAGIAKLKAEKIAQRKQEIEERKEIEKQEKLRAKYQKLMDKFGCTENEAQALLEGEVWIGMSFEMLKYFRGQPDNVNTSNYGQGNLYQACWFEYNPSCFYFKGDGIVYAYN